MRAQMKKATQIFGDQKLHDEYVAGFVEYLKLRSQVWVLNVKSKTTDDCLLMAVAEDPDSLDGTND
ncbi:hypothetical protein ACSBR1_004998 [Camellia fascicularis]